jgi:diacylglycerol kinase family enzyme
MSRCFLLLNRASGGNQRGLDADDVCRATERVFRENGHEITSVMASPKDLEKELERIVAETPDILLIGGGDGSVSAAARHLGGTGIALGILPMGTFNLAARDMGVPLEIDAAARFLATAGSFSIDVLDVSGHACLCTTILGFYPEFAGFFETRDHGGHWWKKTLKLLSNFRSSFTKAHSLRLTWDSDSGGGTAYTKFSAFVPGRYKNSAGLIPERTDFCSGSLTAYIGSQSRPASLLRGILDFVLGRQEQNPELTVVKASRMSLKAARRRSCRAMMDGEILRLSFPIVLSIRPGYLKVLASSELVCPAEP